MRSRSLPGVNRVEALADLADIGCSLAEQIRIRQSAGSSERPIFIIGADLLMAFMMNPKKESEDEKDWKAPAIHAILHDENQPFTLLPPTVETITAICQKLVSRILSLPSISRDYLADRNLQISGNLHRQPIEDLRESARLADEIGRLNKVFSAPNFVGFEAIEAYFAAFPNDEVDHIVEETYRDLCATLKHDRDLHRHQWLYSEAKELALCELARAAGALLYLVTSSTLMRCVRGVSNRSPGDTQSPHSEFVLSPLSLITLLGLKEASPQELHSLHTLSLQTENALRDVDSYDYWPPAEIPEELQELILRAKQLRNVAAPASSFTAHWESAWNLSISQSAPLPIEVQVATVHTIAIEANKAITGLLQKLSLAFLPDQSRSLEAPLSSAFSFDPATTELLRDSIHPSRLAPFKLFIHTEVLNMRQYHISQHGNNNTAIVESYNSIAHVLSGNDEELQVLLQEYVAAISQSELPLQEQNDAIEISTEALSSFREDGVIKGKAKIAWNGLKEVLTEAPKALELWEKITGLLT